MTFAIIARSRKRRGNPAFILRSGHIHPDHEKSQEDFRQLQLQWPLILPRLYKCMQLLALIYAFLKHEPK